LVATAISPGQDKALAPIIVRNWPAFSDPRSTSAFDNRYRL
jgi:hypothetical protein